MKKIFPSGVVRGYFLDVETHLSADDKEYYLCFNQDAEMFVYIFFSPNKMYSRGYWSEKIYPIEFSNYSVDGDGIKNIAQRKLLEILPAGSESEH